MPVTSQVGRLVRNDHEMECSRWDREVTPGAEVLLTRLVWLDWGDSYVEKIAQEITASVASTAMTTIAMSRTDLSCSRKGLSPTAETLTLSSGCPVVCG